MGAPAGASAPEISGVVGRAAVVDCNPSGACCRPSRIPPLRGGAAAITVSMRCNTCSVTKLCQVQCLADPGSLETGTSARLCFPQWKFHCKGLEAAAAGKNDALTQAACAGLNIQKKKTCLEDRNCGQSVCIREYDWGLPAGCALQATPPVGYLQQETRIG